MKNIFDSADEYSVSITITSPEGHNVTINAHEEDPSWPWMFETFVCALRGAGYVLEQEWVDAAIVLHQEMVIERAYK